MMDQNQIVYVEYELFQVVENQVIQYLRRYKMVYRIVYVNHERDQHYLLMVH